MTERVKIPSMKEIESSTKYSAAAKMLKEKVHLVGKDIRAPLVIEIGSRWTRFVIYVYIVLCLLIDVF